MTSESRSSGPEFGWPSKELSKALKRHDQLAAEIKASLTGTDQKFPPATPSPEKPRTPETTRTFNKIVFGHSFKRFDRDQLLAYYLAVKVGAVSLNTPVSFAAEPSRADLQDPKTLVIEPYLAADDSLNTVKSGNYATGSMDEPAAVVFHHHFARELKTLEHASRYNELVTWLKSADTGTPLTKPLVELTSDKLKMLTPLFYGLKLQKTEPQKLLESAVKLIDSVIDPKITTEELSAHYHAQLTTYETKRTHDFAALEARAKDEHFLKKTSTLTGTTLAFFDVRGLGTETGALSIAQKASGADVVMLVDQADGEESSDQAGTQFIFKANSENASLETALSERLQVSEKLFGRGFKLSRTYGGHPGLVASPVEIGSQLAPENVWVALQRYFNHPRYSKAEFENKATELAHKIQTERGVLSLFVPPSDPYSLAEWQVSLTLPQEQGTSMVVNLLESEIGLYEAALTGDVAKNRQLLMQKTALSEPLEVVTARTARAENAVTQFTSEKNATQLLLALDDLNLTSIRNLNLEQQLSILKTISRDGQAIDHVWNKDNLLFSITQTLPEWILKDLETYKAERFKYLSVPKKVHEIVSAVIEKLNGKAKPEEWVQFGMTLETIIGSRQYRETHQTQNYDSLIQLVLQAVTQPTFPLETGNFLLMSLEQWFSPSMEHMWKNMPGSLVTQVQALYPDRLGFLSSPKNEIPPLPDFLKVIAPSEQTVDQSQPIQTVLVQIGRPIREAVLRDGVHGITGKEKDDRHFQDLTFAGEIDASNHTLNLDRKHSDLKVVAKEISKQLLTIDRLAPSSTIRIIAGGFPNMLTQVLIANIPRHLWSKVVFCNYDQQSSRYVDTPTLAEMSSEEN